MSKKNATERLNDLELEIAGLKDFIKNSLKVLADSVADIDERVVILNNDIKTVNSDIIAIAQASGNMELIKKIKYENKIKELIDYVEFMKENNLIVESDTITSNSFVVIRNLDQGGSIVDHRMQFPVVGMTEEQQQLLIGKKVGDLIKATPPEGEKEEDVNLGSTEILEIYEITPPDTEKVFEDKPLENQ